MDGRVSEQVGNQVEAERQTGPDWSALFSRVRLIVFLSLLVFVATDLLGLTSLLWSLIGWLAVCASALYVAYQGDLQQRRAIARAQSRTNMVASEQTMGTALLNQLPDVIVLVDERGRILFQNVAAAAYTGRSAVGKLLSGTFREPDVLQAVERVRAGEEVAPFEIVRSQPVERHFRVSATQAEGTGAVLLVLHDVTEGKRVEQMRVDFVANASHELKTPLASVSGFIETLQGPARDDEEARERFLVIMAEQTDRMKRLIADLLSLSRIELREHQAPKGAVDVRLLVKDVVDAITPIAEREDVELCVALEDNLPSVTGDWDELHQVLQNLVDNAVKYGRSGKRVEIAGKLSAEPGTQRIILSVRDHGPGIPRQHIPRLTERFYRVDAATSRERGGTGLGLAIVKHILNRHGGEMRVESELGQGTEFAVHLKVKENAL